LTVIYSNNCSSDASSDVFVFPVISDLVFFEFCSKKDNLYFFNMFIKTSFMSLLVSALVGKSKSLDFPTNPNLGEIQTFLQIT